jgi:hypothetical protein
MDRVKNKQQKNERQIHTLEAGLLRQDIVLSPMYLFKMDKHTFGAGKHALLLHCSLPVKKGMDNISVEV